ncbi:MAG TPA: diadenylate cyclase CdaA [Thermoanaerobaculia bacterium]|nr:diadenylate cyclase CdaA [Thermoanaerobaculia bacterium]
MKLQQFVELLSWRDLADVLLVAVVIYYFLKLIRGTRAAQSLASIAAVGALYYVARFAHLAALQNLLGNLLIFLPFAVIVLFQQEIRRALASFGRTPFLGRTIERPSALALNELLVAVGALAGRKIGALVVVERADNLKTYAENGIALDAELSYDLLLNLFTPGAPLHDGAVLIQGNRIASAACFLPLTANPELSKDFGTRHRAALGISEETDAVAIVVSEETGVVSVAVDGQLTRDLDPKELLNLLHRLLVAEPSANGGREP